VAHANSLAHYSRAPVGSPRNDAASARSGGWLASVGERLTNRPDREMSFPIVRGRGEASRVCLGLFLGIVPLGSVDEVERGL
jgi:hypothetical protein